jgi:CRP-like cAMP-binding protein
MIELSQYIKSNVGILGQSDLDRLVSLFQRVKIKKGDYLLHSGRLCDKLCFVRSGLLRCFSFTKNKEITQWIFTKGYFATDLASLIFNTPARWSIQALTDTELYIISKENYTSLKSVIPKWTEVERLVLVKYFTNMEERIYCHLSMTAEERYNLFFDRNRELFNQAPLQYLASMLGMTPETLSRIRNKKERVNS